MYLRNISLRNTGPINSFDVSLPFDGDRPLPIVLVGKNGSGKSTVISFIVNAIVSLKQSVFQDIEVENGKVYRIRSPLSINGNAGFFFSQLKFDRNVTVTEWQLSKPRINFADPTPLNSLDVSWQQIPPHDTSGFFPTFGELSDLARMEEMLSKNCLLFFPADRFEPPDWLNLESLSSELKLPEPERMKGRTARRIFSRNRLKPTLDWLNSVIFDMMVAEQTQIFVPLPAPPSADGQPTQGNQIVQARLSNPGKAHAVFNAVQEVLKRVVCEQPTDTLNLMIGDRNSRIISANVTRNGQPVRTIKDLMSLSAGESAMFCLFATIIRDADMSGMQFQSPADIRGIAVIDEADLHLHVGLQYKVLPELIALFPKIQFILSAHAPMVAIGLQAKLGDEGFEILELPTATRISPESYSEFQAAFDAFSETKAFQEVILATVSSTSKPILLVEGKSDAQLISTAWSKLHPGADMPFEVMGCGVEPDESRRSGGSGMLRQSIQFLSVVSDRSICGLFDFDRSGYESFNGLSAQAFIAGVDERHKRHTVKAAHAFLLPVPNDRTEFVNTAKPIHSFLSIEHYFSDSTLQANGFVLSPVIAGSKVFEIDASAATKIRFAESAADLDAAHFENFQLIFDKLSSIGFI